MADPLVRWMRRGFLTVGWLSLALMAGFDWAYRWYHRDATAAQGVVTRVIPTGRVRRDFPIVAFRDSTGQVHEFRSMWPAPRVGALAPGDTVLVRYPSRHPGLAVVEALMPPVWFPMAVGGGLAALFLVLGHFAIPRLAAAADRNRAPRPR